MGLVARNCWRYKLNGSRTYLNMSVSGPNTIAIAGRSLYLRSSLSDSGDYSKEEYYDVATERELQIARVIDDRGRQAVVRTYEQERGPLIGRFDYDAMNQVQFAESVFTTTTTPAGMAQEVHKWMVVNTQTMGTTHDGMNERAIELAGQRGMEVSRYKLVPGYGYTSFTTPMGNTYQVCDACVSDTDEGCTDTQCQQLKNCD